MAVYIAMYFFILLGGKLYKDSKARYAKACYCFFVFLVVTLVLALRNYVMGIDLIGLYRNGYLYQFLAIQNFGFKEIFTTKILNFEQGYIVFNKLLSLFSKDVQTLIIGCAIFTIAPISYFIYKESEKPMESFLIYLGLPCFVFAFSGLRQSLAIGICTLSLIFVRNKKPFKFILVVLIALLFHKSAILFLVVYPVYHFRFTDKIRIASLIVIPVVYIFEKALFGFLSRIFKDNATTTDTGAYNLFILFLAIYFFCTVFIDKEDKDLNGYLNIYFLGCISLIFSNVYSTAGRVSYYFMIPLVVLIPKIVSRMPNKNDREWFSWLIPACFIGLGIYFIVTTDFARAYPYFFFWQEYTAQIKG